MLSICVIRVNPPRFVETRLGQITKWITPGWKLEILASNIGLCFGGYRMSTRPFPYWLMNDRLGA